MDDKSLILSQVKPLTQLEKELLSTTRAIIIKSMPYLGSVGLRMPVRSLNGFGMNLVTQSGLIILDFQAMAAWTPRTAAGELAHLWFHWILDHSERFQRLVNQDGQAYAAPWMVATDIAIADMLNSTLDNPNRALKPPPEMASRDHYGVSKPTAEEIYHELMEILIDEQMPDTSNMDQELEDLLSGGGDGTGQQSLPGNGEPQEDGRDPGQGGNDQGQGQTPHYYSGSGAGGPATDDALEQMFSEDGDLSNGESLIAGWEKTAIQKATAQGMQDYARGKSAGTMPGEFERWAEEILAPSKIDWRSILHHSIRQPLERRMGQTDFTWQKLPRNNGMGGLIQPRMTSYDLGTVGVFVDTSGSMSSEDLGLAINEIKKILLNYRVEAYSIDVVAHHQGPLKTTTNFALKGGGGTDMGVAIERAVEDNLEMAVILTDGETGWRPRPEKSNLLCVAAIITPLDEDSYVVTGVPDWMTTVHIQTTDRL